MIVTSHSANYTIKLAKSWFKHLQTEPHTQASVLPVPYSDSLIITAADNPWEFVMEEHGTNVIKMAVQGEQASSGNVAPHLDLVVITTRHEQWLSLVEIYTSDGAIVFFESFNKGTHTIIPKLDGRRVKRDKNPWSR